jgi:hypothetical protein
MKTTLFYATFTLTLAVGAAAQGPVPVTGLFPPTLGDPARAVWIAVSPKTESVQCDLSAGRQWSCDGVPPGGRGLVVLIGDGAIAAVAVGVSGVDATAATWGRVIEITAGGAAPEDLHDLELTAWKPGRSRTRPQTRRFDAVKDDDVRPVRLSDTSFWVAGTAGDPDAFLALDGPGIGSSRISTRFLSEGAPDDTIYLPADSPSTISGRVHGAHGEDADGAEVELLERLEIPDRGGPKPERADDTTPLLHRLSVAASPDGRFQFDRVSAGPFRVIASHSLFGSGAAWVDLSGPPVDLELTPAPRARGRALKHGLPVPNARVRFLPDADAWAASVDPMEHVSQEERTADNGTFAIPLPPKRAGTIQILLDDGSGVRVAVPNLKTNGDLLLGDLTVPDARRLVVRLFDGLSCHVVAVGPLGALGLKTVEASSQTAIYELDLPDPGEWNLNANCGGAIYAIEPPVVSVPADRQPPAVDARVVR